MTFDLLIRGGTVVDGTGAEPRPADIGVRNGIIAAVDRLVGADAIATIDATGRHIMPGFIDAHSHTDLALLNEGSVAAKLAQGVTTELIGQDGLSYAPLSAARLAEQIDYLAVFNGRPKSPARWRSVADYLGEHASAMAQNMAFLVPHGALRIEAMGWDERAATPAECELMAAALDRGLAEGGVGLSSGLDYFPQPAASFDELVALARVVARHDAVFVAHTRNQEYGIVRAVAELIDVARETGVRVHVSHLRKAEALPEIDRALAEGLSVTFDVYPYTYGSSSLTMYLKGSIMSGGPAAIRSRLGDASLRAGLAADLEKRLLPQRDTLSISNVGKPVCEAFVGRTVGEVADEIGGSFADAIVELFLRADLIVGFIGHHVDEASLEACIAHPAAMGSSDAILTGQRPHPRGWGTYPRFIARYVRDRNVLSLGEAARKFSAAPADCYRMGARGRIAAGQAADLVVLDLDAVADRATPSEPRQYPDGVDEVLVRGRPVWRNGQATGELVGEVITPMPAQRPAAATA